MPTGTLSNLSQSGFVRTPPSWAERIARNLLSFGTHARPSTPRVAKRTCLRRSLPSLASTSMVSRSAARAPTWPGSACPRQPWW